MILLWISELSEKNGGKKRVAWIDINLNLCRKTSKYLRGQENGGGIYYRATANEHPWFGNRYENPIYSNYTLAFRNDAMK